MDRVEILTLQNIITFNSISTSFPRQRLHTLLSLPLELPSRATIALSYTSPTQFYRAQLASHLAGSARTSPVLTGPETSSEVSCNGSPSGGGYVQPRLLAVSCTRNTKPSLLLFLVRRMCRHKSLNIPTIGLRKVGSFQVIANLEIETTTESLYQIILPYIFSSGKSPPRFTTSVHFI